MFAKVVDFVISQDINAWERKALINERFFKTQHLCTNLYSKIKKSRAEMRDIHMRLLSKADYITKSGSAEVRATKDDILKIVNK